MTQEDRKLAHTKRWKQCPNCRNLVERIDGCSHMSCECGIDFCYDCGSRRDSYTTGCPCRSGANRHRRQPPADGDNVPRRTVRRFLDAQIVPIPRRLRTAAGSNPPENTNGIQQNQPAPVVPPATLSTRTNPQAPGAPDTTRVDSSPPVRTPRTRHSLSLNPRQQHGRMDTSNENRAGIPSTATTASPTPAGASQARPIQTPDNEMPKKPAERPLRPRLRPQYDNSRPLFPVAHSATAKASPLYTQPTPPGKRPWTSRPAEPQTNFNEDTNLRPLLMRDKRGHSPDSATQRRLARPSWISPSPVGGFLGSSLARSVASGISTNVQQRAPAPQPTQRVAAMESWNRNNLTPSQ